MQLMTACLYKVLWQFDRQSHHMIFLQHIQQIFFFFSYMLRIQIVTGMLLVKLYQYQRYM